VLLGDNTTTSNLYYFAVQLVLDLWLGGHLFVFKHAPA
jgi:hypothetical protein